MTALLVALGAAVGAPLRYLTDRFIQSRHHGAFPWGTWAVNVAGSALLGAIAGGSGADGRLWALAATGFCGAYTTFSTFSYESARLAEQGLMMRAAANAVGSVCAGLAVCALAFALASA